MALNTVSGLLSHNAQAGIQDLGGAHLWGWGADNTHFLRTFVKFAHELPPRELDYNSHLRRALFRRVISVSDYPITHEQLGT
ncbi:MAG: hypothetical protein JO108_07615 [Acidobacteriaceae bacterium]|nr:hypothetical protein [Acidobacteriaceae bacterium]